MIGGGNDNLFRKLCGVLGHSEWFADPRFANNGLRVENTPSLLPMIEEVTPTKTAQEWADLLDEAGVPNAPVQTIDQVAVHPQTAALDILRGEPGSNQQFFGLPMSFDGSRPSRDEPSPALGRDDDEIAERVKAKAAE